MRFKAPLLTAILITNLLGAPNALASQKPLIENFEFTPSQVELTSGERKVSFKLAVSHPFGIDNESVIVSLVRSSGDTLSTIATRSDIPVNKESKLATFAGDFLIPQNIRNGVYNFTISEIRNNSSAGYQFKEDTLPVKKVHNIIGAEYGVLIRNNGYLNINYQTFNGPAYDETKSPKFTDFRKYTSLLQPIWKAGEKINIGDYFEMNIPTLPLELNTQTPAICSVTGLTLNLLKEGGCAFKVFTSQTKDYESFEVLQNYQIGSARIKPTLIVNQISNQTSVGLPKFIDLPIIYSSASGFVSPKSTTPTVCFPVGNSVKLVSGGQCTITYQSDSTTNYLSSDLYSISFEVIRESQTIEFSLPGSIGISTKTIELLAKASSGGVITYQTTSSGICSITGSTLNLLKSGNCAITATQAGSATLAPISASATVMIAGSVAPTKKTITCVKGNKTKKVSGTNPKCPKGYKVKR